VSRDYSTVRPHSVLGDRTPTEYAATVEEIKRAADTARVKGDYAMAAGTYSILVGSWDEDKAVADALTFKKSDLEAGLGICRSAMRGQEARLEMKAGHFTKAVGLYLAALKDQPGEKSARADYAAAILEIKAAGDKALTGRDYATAGRIHSLLLNSVGSFEGFEGIGKAAAESLRKDRLVEAIKVCRQGLTNSGLAEYRKGNLEKAIEIWDSLLVFDPGNAEIKKAVETAKAQLGKVKRVGVESRGRTSAKNLFSIS
jgi:tetratricopeptide (TPR) repeat protein